MNFLTGLLGIHILFNLCASFTPLSMSKNENTRYNASVKSALARSLSKDDIETNAPGKRLLSLFYNNLNTNFPLNSHGTCAFVSISMLLSYYDAFVCDDFIDENYDVQTTFSTEDKLDTRPIIPFDCTSPGVRTEPASIVSNMTNEQYLTWAQTHEDQYFQAHLLSIAKDMFHWTNETLKNDSFGFGLYEETSLLNYHNIYKQGLNSSVVVIKTMENYASNEDKRKFIFSDIDYGNPVLLNLTLNSGRSDAIKHTVIAYEYDENSIDLGDLIVHPGWIADDPAQTITRISLSQLASTCSGGFSIDSALSFDIRQVFSASDNYKTKNGEISDPHEIYLPHNLRNLSPAFLDYEPIFVWDALGQNPWGDQSKIENKCELLTKDGDLVAEAIIEASEQSFFALEKESWENLKASPGGSYNFSIFIRQTDGNGGWTKAFACEIAKPSTYSGATGFSSSELRFDDSSTGLIKHHEMDGMSFTTTRQRCVQSGDAIKLNCGKALQRAYLKFDFASPIIRFDIEASLSTTAGAIDFKIYSSSNNNDDLVLEKNIGDKTLISGRNWISVAPSAPATSIRIDFFLYPRIKTNVVGELTIFEFAIWQKMPLSGYELDYQPDEWNSPIYVDKANCYCYAVNGYPWHPYNKWDECVGRNGGRATIAQDPFSLREALLSDFANRFGVRQCSSPIISNYIKEIGRFDVAPDGMYKIACFYYGGEYHFYRQNSDGFWSHKNYHDPVSNLDFSGNTIIDPLLSDRSFYDNLLGYFAIRPVLR